MQRLTVILSLLWIGLCSAGPLRAGDSQATALRLGQHAPAVLRQQLEDVVQQHPRLLAARARLEAARARLRAADQALYNPELELDTEDTDIRATTVQISQTLDMGDQRGARTNAADAELRQAEAGFELDRLALYRDLLQALARDHTRQELARLAEHKLRLMRDFDRIAQRRRQAGDLSQVERDLAQLAWLEAQLQDAEARAEAAAAREQLRALFVRLPANLPSLPEDLPVAALPADREAFFRQLPVMRMKTAEVEAARHRVALRRSERSWDPTIALRGGKEDTQSLVGATLTVPLNIRNTYRAEVDTAQQELISVQQEAQQAWRDQQARLNASTERFRLLQQAWHNWQGSGRRNIQRQLRVLERLWRSGDMSTADYLVQLKQTLDTQAAGLELRGKLWQSGFDWLYDTASLKDWLNFTGQH
jgi:cobalt-zinc-cadmium efflux system outer membrane protein